MSTQTPSFTRRCGILRLIPATLVALAANAADANPTNSYRNSVNASNTVIVHYFAPHLEGVAVGHVSMTLPDGTYISWAPQERRLVAPVVPNRTLEQDIAAENEKPIDFTMAVANACDIETWWTSFSKDNKFWVASGPNCTTVVEDALRAGGVQGIPDRRDAWYPNALLPTLQSLAVE